MLVLVDQTHSVKVSLHDPVSTCSCVSPSVVMVKLITTVCYSFDVYEEIRASGRLKIECE